MSEITEAEKQELIKRLDTDGIKEAIREMIVDSSDFKTELKMIIWENGNYDLANDNTYGDGNVFGDCLPIIVENGDYNEEAIVETVFNRMFNEWIEDLNHRIAR
ncbi:hypothetical protein [Methanolobus halotolerans]|uniref:Uncharacterized protein n=1 Tax=Methanolobus halotolerans TaxID=2052935 RepID=A0A4E0PW19_9EURY|nr:hypothetical protein [Methanolobus halotolerans]TGC09464.1 hypothetical protein CUN85_06445 [Methanolobus halotolerans]